MKEYLKYCRENEKVDVEKVTEMEMKGEITKGAWIEQEEE